MSPEPVFDNFVQFKFLEHLPLAWKGCHFDRIHFSNVLFGTVAVPNFIRGPFPIPEQPAVEKLFKAIRKGLIIRNNGQLRT